MSDTPYSGNPTGEAHQAASDLGAAEGQLSTQRAEAAPLRAHPLPVNPNQATHARTKKAFFGRIRRIILVVLGSLTGTAILAVQTYILHRQTVLIAKQTEALALEQSVQIRERIVVASGVEDSVRRLVAAMESEANIEIGLPAALGGSLKVTNFSVNACLTASCSKASIDATVRSISDGNVPLDADVAKGVLRLSAYLSHLDDAIQPLLEAPSELTPYKTQDKLVSLKQLVTSGVTQCFFDPAKARDLSENLSRLRLVSSNAHFIEMPVATPARFREVVAEFPQVGTNTKMGLLEMQSAVADMHWAEEDSSRVTIDEFTSGLASSFQTALSDLIDFANQCNARIADDAAALKSLSFGSER